MHARAARHLADPIGEALGAIVDHAGIATRGGERSFLRTAGGADRGHPLAASHWPRIRPTPPAAARTSTVCARLDPEGRMDQVLGGQALSIRLAAASSEIPSGT